MFSPTVKPPLTVGIVLGCSMDVYRKRALTRASSGCRRNRSRVRVVGSLKRPQLARRISGTSTSFHNIQPPQATATQTNVAFKMKGPITKSHSPREREGLKCTDFSINSHYSCGCDCNRHCRYGSHDGLTCGSALQCSELLIPSVLEVG